ncbi:hypothetical protein FQN50_006817 [Emmonsiellopsis sp. PD_5]|nr:hypothetical protein FQN50_006817 [Emmonsiellopsis sp. PD_5]
MSLSSLPSELLLVVLSPARFSGWPSDENLRKDLINWRLVCKRWNTILEHDVVVNPCELQHLVKIAPEKRVLREMSKMSLGDLPGSWICDGYELNDLACDAAIAGYDRVMDKLRACGVDLLRNSHGQRDDRILMGAVASGNVAALRLVLDCGVKLHRYMIIDMLALAATKNRETVVHFILDKYSADVDIGLLKNAIYRATYDSESVAIMRRFLDECEKRVPGVNHGHILRLHVAIRRGNADMVQLFFDKGADIKTAENAMGTMGTDQPLIHIAAASGDAKIVDLLLDRGAAPDTVDGTRNNTPLMEAARGGHSEIVSRLLLDPRVDPLGQNIYRETPLDLAAGNGHESVVRLLLETAAGKEKAVIESALVEAAKNYCDTAHIMGVVRLLHAAATQISKIDEPTVHKIICQAAGRGNNDIVRLFLDNYGVNARTCEKALYAAQKNGHDEIVQSLLEKYPDIDMIPRLRVW